MRDIQSNGQNLEGHRKYEVIRQQQSNDWIKSRKNAGLEILEKQKDIAFAKEIFNAWDVSKKRYLTFQEITNHLIGLGLADNRQFVQRLLVSIKQKRQKEQVKDEEIELLTLKQFMKVFEFDKFGERACQTIRSEIEEQTTKDFARQTAQMRDSFKLQQTIQIDRGSPF